MEIDMRLTEKEMLEKFVTSLNSDFYKPISGGKILEKEISYIGNIRDDAVIGFQLSHGFSFQALVEFKTTATPKIVSETSVLLKNLAVNLDRKDLAVIFIAPFIAEKQADILDKVGISWMDLCGNMNIEIPEKLYIRQMGKKNNFPDTSPIKKIFEGTSSLVSRAMLLKPEGFKSLDELTCFMNNKNANINMATVSRVLKSLEENLLVNKGKVITVINREKLLDRLAAGYADFLKRNPRKICKFAAGGLIIPNECIACGYYAAQLKGLATTNQMSFFVKDIDEAKKAFETASEKFVSDPEFGNISLIETKEPYSRFNIKKSDEGVRVIDNLELYLEMKLDIPRGPEIAEIIKNKILKGQTDE